MKFWINHPACTEAVSLRRWLTWKLGEWMENTGRRLTWLAIDPDDEIPF